MQRAWVLYFAFKCPWVYFVQLTNRQKEPCKKNPREPQSNKQCSVSVKAPPSNCSPVSKRIVLILVSQSNNVISFPVQMGEGWHPCFAYAHTVPPPATFLLSDPMHGSARGAGGGLALLYTSHTPWRSQLPSRSWPSTNCGDEQG